MPMGDQPIRLYPQIYEAWLAEKPKMIPGGPLELRPVEDLEDPNAVFLEPYSVISSKLPKHYAEKLIIFGHHNEFKGFKIWVTPKDYDYLLMAHQTHLDGSFFDIEGREFDNYPHFHELDLYNCRPSGEPGTRRIVSSELYCEITSNDLLDVFLDYYHFEDGRTDRVRLPKRPTHRQEKIV